MFSFVTCGSPVIMFCKELLVTRHSSKMPFLTFFPAEIEAKEACTWLRAAGFPQYAQLYEGEETSPLLLTHLSNETVYASINTLIYHEISQRFLYQEE